MKLEELDLGQFVDYYAYNTETELVARGLETAGLLKPEFVYTGIDAAQFMRFQHEPHYTGEVCQVSQRPLIYGISYADMLEDMDGDRSRASSTLADTFAGYTQPGLVLWHAHMLEVAADSTDMFHFKDFESRRDAIAHFYSVTLPKP